MNAFVNRLLFSVTMLAAAFNLSSAFAATGTWSPTPTNGSLSLPANWATGGPIAIAAGGEINDTLTFNASAQTSLFETAASFARNITFSAGASAYTWNANNFNLTTGSTTTNTTGTLTNDSGQTQTFNMGAGVWGLNGFITGASTTIINGSLNPGSNVNSTTAFLKFTNSGPVYLNVDSSVIAGGNVYGGAWQAGTGGSSTRGRTLFEGTGDVYLGNIGTAYVGRFELDGTGNQNIVLTHNNSLGGAGRIYFTGGAASNDTFQFKTGAGGVNVSRGLLTLDPRNSLDPHFQNVSGNNKFTTIGDWNTNTNLVGNWNFQSDAGRLTIAGGNIYSTTAAAQTLNLMGAGDGQIDASLVVWSANTPLAVNKSGAGTWTLTSIPTTGATTAAGTLVEAVGANKTSTYTGNMTVSGGVLKLKPTASVVLSGNLSVATAGNLDISSFDSGSPVVTTNALNLASGGTLSFELAGSPFGAPLTVSGANGLTATGSNTVYVTAKSALSPGSYPLINYNGAIAGGGSGALTLGALPHIAASLDFATSPGTVLLNITSADTIRWNGTTSNAWNTATQNWKTVIGTTNANYIQTPTLGDIVTFDDSAVNNFSVNVAAPVQPGAINYNNNLNNYSLSGSSVIAASMNVTGTKDVTVSNSDFTVTGDLMLNGSGKLTFANSGILAFAGPVGLNSGTLVLNRSADESLSSTITGGGTLRKEGSNTLTLTGNNSGFGGAVQVAGGKLVLGNANAAGSSNGITVSSGATLDLNGASLIAPVSLAGNGAGGIGALFNSATAAPVVSDVTLTGNTKIGASLTGAGYNIGGAQGTANAPVGSFNGNGFDLTLDSSKEIDFKIPGDMGIKNLNISFTGTGGPGSFYVAGGTTLGPTNTGGAVNLGNNARLGFYARNNSAVIGQDEATGAVTKKINVLPGATTEIEIYRGNMTIDSPIQLDGTLSYEIYHREGNVNLISTLNGAITGTGNLVVHTNNNTNTSSRQGTVILTANNSYSGTTTIGGGLGLFTAGSVTAATGDILESRDRVTLQIGDGGTTGSLGTGNVINKWTLAFNRVDPLAAPHVVPNVIGGGNGEVVVNSGVVALTGNNDYTGGSRIVGGGLMIGNGGTTGTAGNVNVAPIDIAGGGTLYFNRSNALTINHAITGLGEVRQIGTGTTTLTGNLSATAPVTIEKGTLRFQRGVTTTTTSSFNVNDGGTLAVASFDTFSPVLTVDTLNLGQATGGTLSFELAGIPVVAPLGVTSTMITTGTNKINISGPITTTGEFPLISYGGGAIGGAGFAGLMLNSLPPRVLANLTETPGVSVNLNVTGLDTIRWNGGLSAAWDINSTQNWRTVNTNLPTTYLQPGTLGDSVTFDDTAAGNFNVTAATAVSPSSITFNNSAAKPYTIGGAAITTSALNVTGAGDVTFNNSNLTIASATLNGTGKTTINNTGTLASPSAIALNTGTLALNRATDDTLTSVFSGSGTLRKEGANTLTLSGDSSTFNGAIVVAGGTLKVGHTNALGSFAGDTTIASGATLDLNGAKITELVKLAGTGVGGIGALYNSTTTGSLVSDVELTGNATISSSTTGVGYNIGAAAGVGTPSSGTFNGNGFDLTFDSPNEIDIKIAGDMGVKNLNIAYTGAGTANILYMAGATTMGPTNTGGAINLGNNGRLGFYGRNNAAIIGLEEATGAVTKKINVLPGATTEIETYRGNLTIDSPIQLDGTLSSEIYARDNGTWTTTYTGVFTGAGNLNLHTNSNSTSRFGRFVIQGNSDTFSGTVTIGGGGGFTGVSAANDRVTQVEIGNDTPSGNLGTGEIIMNPAGGTSALSLILSRTDTYTLPNKITANGNVNAARIRAFSGGNATLSGNISGGAQVTVEAVNTTLNLAGNNTYTGVTHAYDGVIEVRTNTALGDPGNENGSYSWVHPVGSFDTSVDSTGGFALTNSITTSEYFWLGTRAPTALTPHITSKSGHNKLTGTLTSDFGGVDSGIDYNHIALEAAGTAVGDLFEITGNVQQYQSGFYIASNNHATSGIANLTLQGAGDGLISGPITERDPANFKWNVVKEGTGKWTLSGDNTYTGDTFVNAGTLSTSNAILPSLADVYLTTGALLNLNFNGLDIVDSLFFDNSQQLTGTWGAIGSGATHESALITGSGKLLVGAVTLPGDFNGDTKVDAADYVLWRKLNIDGPQGYRDWRANFGNPGPGSGAALDGNGAVPEPGTCGLALLALLGVAVRRRSRITHEAV